MLLMDKYGDLGPVMNKQGSKTVKPYIQNKQDSKSVVQVTSDHANA